jgi:hypothetical protein
MCAERCLQAPVRHPRGAADPEDRASAVTLSRTTGIHRDWPLEQAPLAGLHPGTCQKEAMQRQHVTERLTIG